MSDTRLVDAVSSALDGPADNCETQEAAAIVDELIDDVVGAIERGESIELDLDALRGRLEAVRSIKERPVPGTSG